MKHFAHDISGCSSYEEVQRKLAADLGLSCSLAQLSRTYLSATKRHGNNRDTEAKDLDLQLAGKTGAERIAIVRANKDRIRRFLGFSVRGSQGTRNVHRRLK